MTYAGNGSGNTQTPDERVAEARIILSILGEAADTKQMSSVEREFFQKMNGCNFCSPKQLWWLRDLKAKYAE